MTSRDVARQILQSALSQYVKEGSEVDLTTVDLLREIRHQSNLLYEKETIRDLLKSDPFQHWREHADLAERIDRFGERLEVLDIHRTATLSGYAFIDAVIEIPQALSPMDRCKAAIGEEVQRKQKSIASQSIVTPKSSKPPFQLHFRYEKQAEQQAGHTSASPSSSFMVEPGNDPPTVSYIIELSNGLEAPVRLLWLELWADGNRKQEYLKPVNLSEPDDEDDGWEDIDDEDGGTDDPKGATSSPEVPPKQEAKRQKKEGGSSRAPKETDDQLGDADDIDMDVSSAPHVERNDRYFCGIDPDVLHPFLEWIDMDAETTPGMNEATAFFLLMTFPFFEHEWDIIGIILEDVFGSGSDQEGDDEDSAVNNVGFKIEL